MIDEASTQGPAERDRGADFARGEDARSWGDLLDDAGRIAARLRQIILAASASPARAHRGTHPVEVMVACADRYVAAAALLAIWDAGAVAALPPNGREETIDALCAERGISTLLHDGGGRGGLDLRPWLRESAVAGDTTKTTTTKTTATTAILPPPVVVPVPVPRFAPSRPIVCLYTSGSTGAHAACLKTARQLLGEARLLVDFFDMGKDACVLATVPPHHIYGLLFGVLVPLMGGGTLVRKTPHHAETIAAEARRWQANVLASVPAHLQGVTALAAAALPPLRRIFSSGAPLPAATAVAIAALTGGMPVTEVLGSSETGGIAWREGGRDPLWQPFPGVDVTADADDLMIVRSPFTPGARGNNDGEIGDDGRGDEPAPFHGADRIRLAAGGRFELLGRADGVVKIGGSRIAIAEIERRLLEIPGVREAVVLAVDVASLRQHELWAVAVAPDLTAADLRTALLRRVEPIAVPRRFRLVDALPREANGKLVKARLRALFTPSTPIEQAPANTDVAESAHAPAPEREPPGAEDAPAPERDEVKLIIDAASPFFAGHFDGFPVLPGVVQLNNLVLDRIRVRWPELGRLQKVMGLKFRNPIRPRDEIAIVLERATPNRVGFEIRRDTRVMSSGALVFAPGPADPARRQGEAAR